MSQRHAIITGVTSFVGCHLARAFAAAGYDVTAVSSRPRAAYGGVRAERLTYISDAVDFAVCDLTDAEALAALIDLKRPDVWVQHAGYAENYASPDYDLAKSLPLNVVALEPLFQLLDGTGCGVLVTGTSMEYASSDQANREGDVCWPDLPYGVSKLAETVETSRLARQYGVPARVARIYIPVGAYDALGKLLDFVINKLVDGEPADLSPCEQKRDFIGVEDICAAYLKLADDFDRTTFDLFNVCSGEARELKALLLDVARLMDADPALLKFGARPMRTGEAMVSYGDNAKAREILDWQPSPIEKALTALIDHVRGAP